MRPWEFDKLTARDIQLIKLDARREAYLREQQEAQAHTGPSHGSRSAPRSDPNSKRYQEFRDQYGRN